MSVVARKGLRPTRAADKCGVGLSTLWEKAKNDPDFPKPVKLSPRVTVFFEDEIDTYLEKRAAESRGTVAA